MRSGREYLIHLFAFVGIVLADQLTKRHFMDAAPKDFGWFGFTFVKNTGSAFGILKGIPLFFIILSFVVLGILAWYYERRGSSRYGLWLCIIGAGVVGNLLDRILLGFVVDFVDLKFWPVFNVADSAIVIGVVGLLFMQYVRGRIRRKPDSTIRKI